MKKEKQDVEHIVSFSGGKDSTAMLFMMLERKMRIDRIIRIDTTKEFPQVYDHIKLVQERCPIEIETIKIDFDYYFSEHIKTKGKNIGDKGYGWPDMRLRWCTALKRQAFYFLGKGHVQYHGISADEQQRATNKNRYPTLYPLVDWGITEAKALQYCYDLGFDWGGLYEEVHRVSCWCCPLQSIAELKQIYIKFPKLWKELQEMDKKSFRRFKHTWSIEQLTQRFAQEEANENSLFDFVQKRVTKT